MLSARNTVDGEGKEEQLRDVDGGNKDGVQIAALDNQTGK